MLNIQQILDWYPKNLHWFEQFIFKEYLQYLILQIIFESPYKHKLIFLWGTCLRIVHNSRRFSEDLDFDNINLSKNDFDDLSKIIAKRLGLQWFEVEVVNIYKWAYHCKVKIPKILHQLWYSDMEDEKILIQIDTVPQHFSYTPETHILEKFWLTFPIATVPKSIIASQKIYAIMNRKRPKWRDYFDLSFLLSHTWINMEYIHEKLGRSSHKEIVENLIPYFEKQNAQDLLNDTRHFLFDVNWENNILLFSEIIKKHLGKSDSSTIHQE